MRTLKPCIFFFIFLTFCLTIPSQGFAQAASQSEIDLLKQELSQIRNDYEKRIQQLEKRLDEAEQKAVVTESSVESVAERQDELEVAAIEATPIASGNSSSNTSRFNPAIGVVFQGQIWSSEVNPDDAYIPGFPLGGEAGAIADGISLGETEINFTANVDDKFTARLTVPVVIEDGEAGVELEEAWIETTALPGGLALLIGQHKVNIGYLNTQHSHTWDFADQPLPYKAFLGGQYGDTGVALRWLAPTDFYLELSGEINRGSGYPAGGDARNGFGASAFHIKTGGDIGFSNSWLAGLSYLAAEANERESGDEDDPLLFTGQADLMMAEFVWKWAPNGNNREQNFKFMAEYIWSNSDGDYTLTDGQTLAYDVNQAGWYLQAVYQPIPRWRIGLRWDQLSSDNPGSVFDNTALMPMSRDPYRYSLMGDWSNSEFSRLRLQYIYDRSGPQEDNQFGLQYIFSIGAHGGHTF
jgi:hypothetical protein